MAQAITQLLNRAAQANVTDEFRQGNIINLPGAGSLIVSGDLHGHRRNFERIVTFANLANNPQRHLLLQEIIHGGNEDPRGGCLSYRLLFDAIRLKLEFPRQVHFIIGNHDTAFICSGSVMKDGKEMNLAMNLAMEREFKDAAPEIKEALIEYLLSQPLAVRCQNRICMSHSLPADRYADKFDPSIFNRQITAQDCLRNNPVYQLTWGRKHSQGTIEKMRQVLNADIFILGHQSQKEGWAKFPNNLIIISSEHNHGCLLPIDLSVNYTIDKLADAVVPLASIE